LLKVLFCYPSTAQTATFRQRSRGSSAGAGPGARWPPGGRWAAGPPKQRGTVNTGGEVRGKPPEGQATSSR